MYILVFVRKHCPWFEQFKRQGVTSWLLVNKLFIWLGDKLLILTDNIFEVVNVVSDVVVVVDDDGTVGDGVAGEDPGLLPFIFKLHWIPLVVEALTKSFTFNRHKPKADLLKKTLKFWYDVLIFTESKFALNKTALVLSGAIRVIFISSIWLWDTKMVTVIELIMIDWLTWMSE